MQDGAYFCNALWKNILYKENRIISMLSIRDYSCGKMTSKKNGLLEKWPLKTEVFEKWPPRKMASFKNLGFENWQ